MQYRFSQTLSSLSPQERICCKCKFVFPDDTNRGTFHRHEQFCNPRGRSVNLVSATPMVPANLLALYHQDGTDNSFECFDDVGGQQLVRDLFDAGPPGQQEAPFKEVVLRVFEADDAELPFRPPPMCRVSTSFSDFQLSLLQRAAEANPYGFRSTAEGLAMNKLVDVFAFVRKYNLSSQACY